MEFSRDGKHTIRCVISEEEIEELGYTIEDIITNGERTQEFMNRIFDLAEQEFETKFETGIKTVRADILPNHTVSLTFSEHPGTEGMMEQIKDIVNGLLSTIPKEKWNEIKSLKGGVGKALTNEKTTDNEMRIIVLFSFEELDTLIRYAKQVSMEHLPYNQLYKFEEILRVCIE